MYKGRTQGRAPVSKKMSKRESIHWRNKLEEGIKIAFKEHRDDMLKIKLTPEEAMAMRKSKTRATRKDKEMSKNRGGIAGLGLHKFSIS